MTDGFWTLIRRGGSNAIWVRIFPHFQGDEHTTLPLYHPKFEFSEALLRFGVNWRNERLESTPLKTWDDLVTTVVIWNLYSSLDRAHCTLSRSRSCSSSRDWTPQGTPTRRYTEELRGFVGGYGNQLWIWMWMNVVMDFRIRRRFVR